MSNEEPNTPADTARERAAFADRAEQLLRETLTALGYDAANLTTADLVHGFMCWLGILQMYRAEPTSPAAETWRALYGAAYSASPMADARARRADAKHEADAATDEFLRRFPPRFESVDRQSLDDIAAMRDALDEQTEATTAARIGEKHWRELAEEQRDRAEKAERELVEARANLHGEKAAARWLVQQFDVPADVDFSNQFAWMAAEYRRVLAANQSLGWELEDAKRGALLPQPKPERVEPGQRWAFVMIATDQVDHFANRRAWKLEGEAGQYWCAMPEYSAFAVASMHYLGSAPTSEG